MVQWLLTGPFTLYTIVRDAITLWRHAALVCAGLVEDQEVEGMNDLVEQKLKKLHYFPPQFHIQPPHTMLAAHPLLAGVPEKKFRKEVCCVVLC